MLTTQEAGTRPRRQLAWMVHYRNRLTSAEEAVRLIRSGDQVFLAGMCSVPKTLLAAVVNQASTLHEVKLTQVLALCDPDVVRPGMEEHLRVNALFISPPVRQAVNEGRADFTPIFLSEIPDLLRTQLKPDVALIQVSPPDEDGFCSLGVEVAISKGAAIAARQVVAEVNPQMPYTLGDSFIHVSRLHAIVEVDYPLPEAPMGSGDPVEQAIGRHIATLIEDGATLQMGIGGIPNGVLQALKTAGIRDLGIHTEMFADGVIDLIEQGIVTNGRKTVHRGKVIAGFMLGTRRLFGFVDHNPLFEMHPIDYVNDPYIIAQNDRMTAINSALEVDLTGQVCADSIGHRLFSGVGGQVDFMRGAARSKRGKPIIALASTARAESVSRIVDTLQPGAGVVTSRNDVHYVVTEYGIAYLHGKTIRERAQALIAIAHPKFRDELTARARQLHYL